MAARQKNHQADPHVRKVEKDGTTYIEFERRSKWNSRHSPQCVVCNHPSVGEIEYLYFEWVVVESLATKFDIDLKTLRNHFEKLGLRQERIGNRRNVYEHIVERGLQTLRNPSTAEVLNAMQHLDKLDGQVVERSEHKVIKTEEERYSEMQEVIRLTGGGLGKADKLAG